jgi:hypothetical protein
MQVVYLLLNNADHCVLKSVWKDVLIVVKEMKQSHMKEENT